MSATAFPDESVAYLAQPALQRPLAAARAQVERLGRVGGTLQLDELAEDEASALAGLFATLARRIRPAPAGRSGSRCATSTQLSRPRGSRSRLPRRSSSSGRRSTCARSVGRVSKPPPMQHGTPRVVTHSACVTRGPAHG